MLIILIAPFVNAENITMSLDQQEYYFKTGENAIINLKTDSSYNSSINGMLSYTITQEINQGNLQYSNSNTQSTSFSVNSGETDNGISFGTSDNPTTLTVNLKFSYTDNETKEVSLNNIKIYFVNDDSQKNNQQNKVSSSSQKSQTSQQQNDPFAQQAQQMQDMLNQMTDQEMQQQSQTSQQKLQNNQMAQDSSALKQQMQKQAQEQQEMKQEFQKQLAQNSDFQKEHQDLLNQGYNLTNANVNPSTNNTGDFDLNYENQNGDKASLKGSMQNGEMQNIQKDTPQSRQEMLDKLQQNKEFQKYQNELQQQGFQKNNTEFSTQINKTNIQMNYVNQNNETASISADIINDTVKNVEVTNDTVKEKKNYFWIILIILAAGIIGFLFYKKLFNKKRVNTSKKNEIKEKPFDYKTEALTMLDHAEILFNKEEFKDAYMFAGQALRLFLSYKNNLKKEVTNDEIIKYLKEHKQSYKDAKDCFDLCSLVEFAKYKANEKDFRKILEFANKIIK